MSRFWSPVVHGLLPGELPKLDGIVKLNTNEKPLRTLAARSGRHRRRDGPPASLPRSAGRAPARDNHGSLQGRPVKGRTVHPGRFFHILQDKLFEHAAVLDLRSGFRIRATLP